MIERTPWSCPEGLIEQALLSHPISDSSAVLNEPTGDFFYDPWTIKNEFKGTPWEEILNTLPYNIGQARIIVLAPGESYQAHADIDNRLHLNLTGHLSFLIDLTTKTMHDCTRNNRWLYMNAGRIHAATNFGSMPRLQLVVRELLFTSQEPKDLVAVTIEPGNDQSQFRYKFDNLVSPWLNRMNQQYKLANFSTNLVKVHFKIERECLQELKTLLTADYKLTVHTS